MPMADGYRRQAAEAECAAAHTRDPQRQSQFLEIARQWRELADEADRLAAKGRALLDPPGDEPPET